MKRVSVIFALLFIAHCSLFIAHCYSQQPTQEWVARYAGPYNDLYGPFLALDKSGNSYIAGTHVINDSINILCVKYSTSGVQQWATLYKYPGNAYFAPTGLALDSLGNAYVTSMFGVNSFASYNCLLTKFDNSSGNVVWFKTYIGLYGNSRPMDIKIDKQNNIYVVGSSDTSSLVMRYNTNGDTLWTRKFQLPPARDIFASCTIDDSLNVIAAGRRRYCITFPPPGGCFDTLLTAKYTPGGVLRWARTFRYTNNNDASASKIVCDQNGNAYIGGVTFVSGYGVYLTLKYDLSGSQQWAKIYVGPGSGNNTIYGLAVDRTNNSLFVTGYSLVNSTGSAATIKYNTLTGDSVWVRRGFGVLGSSSSWDVATDSTGNVYVTGSSIGTSSSDVSTLKYSPFGDTQWFVTYNGPFNSGDGGRQLAIHSNNVYVLGTSQSTPQISDYVVIKYDQISGIKQTSNEAPATYVLKQNFPNPFNLSTRIGFAIPKTSFVQLVVYDVLGRTKEVLERRRLDASNYELSIDAASYASGIYFYQLIADGIIIDTKKLILIK